MPPLVTCRRLFAAARCFYLMRVRHRFYSVYCFHLLRHEGVDLKAVISLLISLSLRKGTDISVAVEAQSSDAPPITAKTRFIHGIWKSCCFIFPAWGGIILDAILSVATTEDSVSFFID